MVKRRLSIMMVILILFLSFSRCYITARASSIVAGITAWEVLQALLLTVGVTVETSYLIDNALPQGWQDTAMDAMVEAFNDYKSGLGDAIDTVCQTAVASGATAAVFTKSVWDDVKNWVASSFSGNVTTVTYDEYMAYTFTTAQQIYNAAGFNAVSPNSDLGEKILEFMAQNPSYKYLACCRVVSPGSSSVPRSYFCLTQSPTTYSLQAPSSSFSNYYLVADAGVNFICQYAPYNNDMQYWSATWNASTSGTTPVSSYASVNGLYGAPTFTRYFANSEVVITNRAIIDSGYKADILDDTLEVVTPTTVYDTTTGALTGDVTITLPDGLTDVLDGVLDGLISITDALEACNVKTVDKTDSKEIEDAIAAVKPVILPIEDYAVELAELFPFCVPFDFIALLECLSAEPVAPSFTFRMPTGYSASGDIVWNEYTISLAQFDNVAVVLRDFELLAYVIGLIFLTRNIIRG